MRYGHFDDPNREYVINRPLATADALAEAVEEQLGLKLEPKKIPVEMLILDSADKIPTAN